MNKRQRYRKKRKRWAYRAFTRDANFVNLYFQIRNATGLVRLERCSDNVIQLAADEYLFHPAKNKGHVKIDGNTISSPKTIRIVFPGPRKNAPIAITNNAFFSWVDDGNVS